MNKKLEYKKRVVDSLVERYLKIFGAICIEDPKSCGLYIPYNCFKILMILN